MPSGPLKVPTGRTKLTRDLYPVRTIIVLKKMPLWKIPLCLPFCLALRICIYLIKQHSLALLYQGLGGGENNHQMVSLSLVCPHF